MESQSPHGLVRALALLGHQTLTLVLGGVIAASYVLSQFWLAHGVGRVTDAQDLSRELNRFDLLHSGWFTFVLILLILNLLAALANSEMSMKRGAILIRSAALLTAGALLTNAVLGFQKRILIGEGETLELESSTHRSIRLSGEKHYDEGDLSSVWLRLESDGRPPQSVQLTSSGGSRTFSGFNLKLLGSYGDGAPKATLRVSRPDGSYASSFSGVVPGRTLDLEGASARLLQLAAEVEQFGAGAQLEYREGAKKAERFWIFHRYPGFDESRRKGSRYHFVLESLVPGTQAILLVSRNPARPVVWLGIVMLAVSIGIQFMDKRARRLNGR